MLINEVKEIVEEIISDSGGAIPIEINLDTELKDLGLSSFDLATLTVMIEDKYDIDIFEDGLIYSIGDILSKLDK
jgi:acyl carrier protein